MWTIFVSTVLIVTLVAINSAVDVHEDVMKIFNECKKQEKATDEDVQTLLHLKEPQTQSAKCLMACAYEKTGAIKDGKVDGNAVKETISKYEDAKDKHVNAAIVDGCNSISNSDRCELATQYTECLLKGAIAHQAANGTKDT